MEKMEALARVVRSTAFVVVDFRDALTNTIVFGQTEAGRQMVEGEYEQFKSVMIDMVGHADWTYLNRLEILGAQKLRIICARAEAKLWDLESRGYADGLAWIVEDALDDVIFNMAEISRALEGLDDLVLLLDRDFLDKHGEHIIQDLLGGYL